MTSIIKLAQGSKYVGGTFILSIGLLGQMCWLMMIVDSFCGWP
ncbi:hypothetical protein F383_24005 [Gossypium arboreum]|uniref:Uncharacterized protein n=1 Tax=Gossypium arboreum TaxID=29729 RepID=A0A0B0P068_GOSAR|nr:hypothetical protein F383_24005 [Gossypium arboreum]